MSQYVPDTPTCPAPQPASHPNLPRAPTCCSPLLTEPLHDCIDDGDALVLRKVIAKLWGQAALPLASPPRVRALCRAWAEGWGGGRVISP